MIEAAFETVLGEYKNFQIIYPVRFNGHMGTNIGNGLAFLSHVASLTFISANVRYRFRGLSLAPEIVSETDRDISLLPLPSPINDDRILTVLFRCFDLT
eukprot:scaffold709_cov67-Cyclotella_meneghiniana.AAC.13